MVWLASTPAPATGRESFEPLFAEHPEGTWVADDNSFLNYRAFLAKRIG